MLKSLSANLKIFLAETVGTFVIVILASGSVVLAAKYANAFGLWFVAICPAIAVSAMVFVFQKISMAHFNPAVTLCFLITKYTPRNLLITYIAAQTSGAFLASVFVKYVIGTQSYLGSNYPNHSFPVVVIFGVEVFATALLMSMIILVVHTKGLTGKGWISIGSVVFVDIFFLSFISGASMNPIRSIAPAIVSGHLSDLWLYCSAPFVGSSIVALIYRKFVD